MQLQHLRQDRLFAWKDNKSPPFTNQAFYKTMVTGNLVYDIQKTLKREMCRVQFLFLVQQWQTEMISCFVSDKKWNASVYIFVTPTGKIKAQQGISLNKKNPQKNNLVSEQREQRLGPIIHRGTHVSAPWMS